MPTTILPGQILVSTLLACAGLALATSGHGRSLSDDGAAPVLAFPGAEGFGRFARGGRGGEVFTVRHLGDAGPGSLRAAVEAEGPRTVVFAVAGTIALSRPLRIENGRITIAGQSAPGEGITLRDQPLIIAADDVVIRYLRSRLGDASGVEDDAIWIQAGRDIILDHVSASWSTDEVLSVANLRSRPDLALDRVTVQWSFITEALDGSVHEKGEHGFGSLVRGSRGARYSFHHNLWAHHRARVPRPGNYASVHEDPVGLLLDVRHNVIYNWGTSEADAIDPDSGKLRLTRIAAAGYNVDPEARSRYNVVGNAYLPGPDTAADGHLAFFEAAPQAQAHFAGNRMAGVEPADPWQLVLGGTWPGYRLAQPIPVAPVTGSDADTVLTQVLARAGASLRRDAVDLRIVEQVRAGTGRIIDSQDQVAGWPDLAGGEAPTDRDGDGIPDDWELAHGLDPDDASDAARRAPNSPYTWLELYLDSLL